MHYIVSAALRFRNRNRLDRKGTLSGHTLSSFHFSGSAEHHYPYGQGYSWGGSSTPTQGFAPAIGYDGHFGGNGY